MIVTVHNSKGGVGKTTTTINLGVALAAAGQTVLVIDGDYQHNATFGLGRDERPAVYRWIVADVFEPERDVRPGLDLLPSARQPLWWEQSEVAVVSARLRALPPYDWVLVDTSPSYSRWVASLLALSDAILIPVDFSVYSVIGVNELLAEVDPRKVIGLVPVRYDLRNNRSIELLEVLKRAGGHLVAPPIRISVDVDRAAQKGLAVFEYNARSPVGEDYLTLAEWMVNALAETRNA